MANMATDCSAGIGGYSYCQNAEQIEKKDDH